MSLSLSVSLPPSLSLKSNEKMSPGDDKKEREQAGFPKQRSEKPDKSSLQEAWRGLDPLGAECARAHTHTLEYNEEGNLAYCDNMDGPTGCCMK